MKLLKASLITCQPCKGKGCLKCRDNGYLIFDRSWEEATHGRIVRTEPEPEPPKRKRGLNPLAQQRLADCLCINCGSPNLVNDRYCQECKDRNAMAKSRSKSKSI